MAAYDPKRSFRQAGFGQRGVEPVAERAVLVGHQLVYLLDCQVGNGFQNFS